MGIVLALLMPHVAEVGAQTARPSTTNLRLTPQWIDADHFVFRRQTESGQTQTVRVDAATGEMTVVSGPGKSAGQIGVGGFRGGAVPTSGPSDDSTEIILVNQSDQPVQMAWVDSSGNSKNYEIIPAGKTHRQHTYAGHVWTATGIDGTYYGSVIAESPPREAKIKTEFERPESGVAKGKKSDRDAPKFPFTIRVVGQRFQYALDEDPSSDKEAQSDKDASRQKWKTVETSKLLESIQRNDSIDLDDATFMRAELSPDGKFATFWIRTPGDGSKVHTIESSPKQGGRAKLISRRYKLPGDSMETFRLVLVETETWSASLPELPVIDFGWPKMRWYKQHQLLIEKVDRGHQRFRLFAVDPSAESPGESVRTVIDEPTETFIWTAHGQPVDSVTYLASSDAVIYASERSGYRHLYWVELDSDSPMRPITEGDYLVRELIHVNEQDQYLDLVVGEFHDDQDPYHRHLIRVSLADGSLTELTDGDGDHEYGFSPNRKYVIVNHSRVDSPPVHELRSCKDGKLLATLAVAKRIDQTNALPTRFSAKGRDGKTDIWGLICFPDTVDPAAAVKDPKMKYPVLEYIYAGPHDSHVPKRYRNSEWMADMTKLGFIVVRIDGMGTANRSKAFHDVAWKNLKDAGFPDRIAWMKAAAKEFSMMDLSRVGIYGTSAGGQNACGALLFHGDFYKAAVASCGCHDNRMDKASWNEQWMGAEIGPYYSQCSNIDQAHRLKGDLFLLVGELDSNVPPESTYRLVDALIKADKRFKFLMIPGMGHSDGGNYGRQLTREFFVDKLKPPTIQESGPSPSPLDVSVADLEAVGPVATWEDNTRIYNADRGRLSRQFPVRLMPERLVHMDRFYRRWETTLAEFRDSTELPSETWSANEKTALGQLSAQLWEHREQWESDRNVSQALMQAQPWVGELMQLCDCRRRGLPVDAQEVSRQLSRFNRLLAKAADRAVVAANPAGPDATSDLAGSTSATTLDASYIREINSQFADWQRFYADYDPQFDWWNHDLADEVGKRLKKWNPTIESGTANGDEAGDQTLASIFDQDYPNSVIEMAPASRKMPAIMRRFSSDLNKLRKSKNNQLKLKNTLLSWQTALGDLQIDGQPLPQWDRLDQVDYHLLINEINYRLSVIDGSGAAKVVSKSRDDSGIEGVVVGRQRLLAELQAAQIDHTPEELIEMAESGYTQCRAEMVRVAGEMGLGDDWQAAVEKIKSLHVEVGKQPELIRQTAADSSDWLREHDLLTIDRFADNSWRMQMMTPQRQRVNPFFTGGETISVSFPTRQMSADEKRQSLRGNNQPYARATVHHELIPGHHLQGFSNSRYQTHRAPFGSPFWLEGWAVYWEFVLYENGFTKTPEERMGFLVWRAHRYARILFSLRFHLGQLTPDQCVDFLVDNVGFDRRNAEGEVRRSVGPSYPPLYQAAYMVGAMQFRALADRWTQQERGSLKEFHDAVLRQGSMPIASLEAILFDTPIDRQHAPAWRFKQSEWDAAKQ